jgi:hypothetical protein
MFGCIPTKMIGDEKWHQQQAYSFLIIFSAANLASASDAWSSGVTTLAVVLPWIAFLDCRTGEIAARQCPGLRSYVTIENCDSSAIAPPQKTSRLRRWMSTATGTIAGAASVSPMRLIGMAGGAPYAVQRYSALPEFDGWDGPLSIVTPDRDSQAVQFVKPNVLDRPSNSVSEDHGFAHKLILGLLELAEDRGRTDLHSWRGWPRVRVWAGRCLHLKGVQVVTGARQTGVNGTPRGTSTTEMSVLQERALRAASAHDQADGIARVHAVQMGASWRGALGRDRP